MRKHIFNAGPCKLPDMTLENTAKACDGIRELWPVYSGSISPFS